MAADPHELEECPIDEADIAHATDRQTPSSSGEIAEGESARIAMEKARRLVAAELDIAETQRLLLESNLKITEAQLELVERQLDQLIAENQRLRQENDALKGRLGESASRDANPL